MNRKFHWPKITYLATAALALWYFVVVRALDHKTAALDEPLRKVWKEFQTSAPGAGDPRDLKQAQLDFRALEQVIATLQNATVTLKARVTLEADIQTRIRDSFQLVDYQNERQNRIRALSSAAKEKQVTLDPPALAFPEYTMDRNEPSLLWAQLALGTHVLNSAVQSKISTVKLLSYTEPETWGSSTNESGLWTKVPMRIALVGSMPALHSFLHSLPRRGDELKPAGLPETSADKPAVFVEQILLRKTAPERPDEVAAELRLCGFVWRP
ncbi:MAG: hypothetical protein AB1813_28840 [Verrucomicrobiota bacterium]